MGESPDEKRRTLLEELAKTPLESPQKNLLAVRVVHFPFTLIGCLQAKWSERSSMIHLGNVLFDLSAHDFRPLVQLDPPRNLSFGRPLQSDTRDLVVEMGSSDELSHGSVWQVYPARLIHGDSSPTDTDEHRPHSGAWSASAVSDYLTPRSRPSSPLHPLTEVVVKVVLTPPDEGETLTLISNEAHLYNGPLAPLQGHVVPECFGVFGAQIGEDDVVCCAMILERLDPLPTSNWAQLTNRDRQVPLKYTVPWLTQLLPRTVERSSTCTTNCITPASSTGILTSAT